MVCKKTAICPKYRRDFIFANIGEELGLIATLLVVLAFVVIVICGISIALKAREPFGGLLAMGVTMLIGLQAAINIGVVTSALPNKGLALPFISYGGSNLLAMLACIGILFSVARHAPAREKIPHSLRRDSRQSIRREGNMTDSETKTPFVAIACGGTGGHLFPGIAVAEELKKRGCKILLLLSSKEIDLKTVQFHAVNSLKGFGIWHLPAVGLQNRNYYSFVLSFWRSYRTSRILFKAEKPDAVLAMGGFTSAPPILAARKFGSKTFLHESNTIPGRTNRFLARFVNEAFIGFPETAPRLRAKKVFKLELLFASNFLNPQSAIRNPQSRLASIQIFQPFLLSAAVRAQAV